MGKDTLTAENAESAEILARARRVFLAAVMVAWLHRGRCYEGLNPDRLLAYLAFHWMAGTLFVSPGGLMVAWPASAGLALEREHDGLPVFDWTLPMPAAEADCFIVAEVIAPCLEDQRELVEMATEQWPDWRSKRLLTFRKGRLHELGPRVIGRFLGRLGCCGLKSALRGSV